MNYGVIKRNDRSLFAYEVDGLGNYNLMDDSNVPSLLSAPYLGYCDLKNKIYQNTRHFLFSKENQYFYCGEFYSGLGSPHTPKDYIWPLAIEMTGLTSNNVDEKRNLLYILANTTNNTNMIHESFDVNDPSKFTRPWFSWANMLYCELLLDYLKKS